MQHQPQIKEGFAASQKRFARETLAALKARRLKSAGWFARFPLGHRWTSGAPSLALAASYRRNAMRAA